MRRKFFLVPAAIFLLASCGSDPAVCPNVSCPSGMECVEGECVPPGDPCDGVTCGENASCRISLGAGACVCDEGFAGDGSVCLDVDECSEGTAGCEQETEVCRNFQGGFACECREGFELDGGGCVDLDECALGLYSCSENAACFNTPGSYECRCHPGYSGDGTACHPSWSRLAAGLFHYCAIRGDGSLWCWGANNFEGQLGQGDEEPRLTPTQVGAHQDWIDISTEHESNCGIRADKSLWCWGRNDYGQLGIATDTVWVPTRVGLATDWTSVAVGQVFACGIREPGSLYCWGHGWGATPVRIGSDQDWLEVDAGNSRACGRRAGGALFCWMTGQSSVSPWTTQDNLWDRVALGGGNVCATREGALFCDGPNGAGQVGVGSELDHIGAPERVDPGGAPFALPGGMNGSSTCAIRADGSAWCWGANIYGALGHGVFVGEERSPVQVSGGHFDWEQLEPMAPVQAFVSDMVSCGLRDGGRLFCWGGNQFGMIDGASPHRTTLTPADGPALTAISSGGALNCGIDRSKALICWGLESVLRIGPFRVPGVYSAPSWDTIEMGEIEYGCGLRGTELWCFGANHQGQLGQGHTDPVQEIVRVGPADLWRSTSVGRSHACGIRTDDSLFCWGQNSNGQIGAPPGAPSFASTPIRVGLGNDWEEVAAGDLHTCGIRGGRLYCWGSNLSGQLGMGFSGGSYSDPQLVDYNWTDWTSVRAGRGYTCGLRSGGSAWCWGVNSQGQAGAGVADNPTAPWRIGTDSNWATIATGWQSNTCGIRTDGTLWTWGANSFGQLGDGSDIDLRDQPGLVGLDADWVSCSLGYGHLCALKSDGSVWCAGLNNAGQLGDGRAWHYEPTPVAPDL